jgi:CheY-like chemotaxis protein
VDTEAEMREEKILARQDFPILVADDVEEVRRTIEGFLTRGGFPADGAETPIDLLHKLKEGHYSAVLLDIDLGDETSCEEAYDLCRELFPEASFPYRRVLNELGLSPDDPASGFYLLPMVKAVAPSTDVLMLTGSWRGDEDEGFLKRYGSYLTIQKLAPDATFAEPTEVKDLDEDLCRWLDQLRKERSEELRAGMGQ